MEDEIVHVKVFDETGDVLFEGEVSTEVAPNEIALLWEVLKNMRQS